MKNTLIKLYSTLVILFVIALTMGTSTFAWFTNNNTVYTDRITGKTEEEGVALYLGYTSGTEYKEELPLAVSDILFPVSTDDLVHFVAAGQQAGTDDGVMIKDFVPVTSDHYGDYFYHKTIYIQAKGTVESAFNLYLDLTGTNKILDEDSNLYATCRLGMVIYDDTDTEVFKKIFRFTEEHRTTSSLGNTQYTGFNSNTTGGQVVKTEAGVYSIVDDPSVFIEDYAVLEDADLNVVMPDEALVKMEINKVYKMDLFFYLEGCDPDCTDAETLESYFRLYFMGVMADE